MAAVPAVIVAAAIGAAANVGTALLTKPGKPKAIQAQPRPTRMEARERSERNDILSRRRGTGENRRVGFGAGEAFTGPKKSLLGRG